MNQLKEININEEVISNYALLIKLMRLKKKLNRKQAGLILGLSYKSIEKIENGRGCISVQKFKSIQEKFGIIDSELLNIKEGNKNANEQNQNGNEDKEKRKHRRFCQRIITRECKVLKEMRLMKKLDQISASKLCGFSVNTIAFIENGRISLTQNKIKQILFAYGYSMELFNQLLNISPLRHELIEICHNSINKMDENKLRIILPILQNI